MAESPIRSNEKNIMLCEMQALYRRMIPLHHVVVIYLRQDGWDCGKEFGWGLLEQRRRAVSNQRTDPDDFYDPSKLGLQSAPGNADNGLDFNLHESSWGTRSDGNPHIAFRLNDPQWMGGLHDQEAFHGAWFSITEESNSRR